MTTAAPELLTVPEVMTRLKLGRTKVYDPSVPAAWSPSRSTVAAVSPTPPYVPSSGVRWERRPDDEAS